MLFTLIHCLRLEFCHFGTAAEHDSSFFGHAGHYHGQQHARHQEDQTDAEVGSCGTDTRLHLAQRAHVATSCVCGWLTDDGVALAVSGQHVVEDEEEHGEAEHQRDLEGVALAASQRQGEADNVCQDDQDTGQHQCDEGVEEFDRQWNLRERRCTSQIIFLFFLFFN